jgi:hypothetical protein
MQESGTPVGNGGPSSMSGNINAGNNEGSISLGASGNGQMQNMLNGGDQCGDVKQSPSSFHGTNTAGGTPGSGGPQSTPVNMLASGGPGSVVGGGPESVHSQSGAVPPNGGNSTPQQQTTPTEGSSKDFMQHQGNGDVLFYYYKN